MALVHRLTAAEVLPWVSKRKRPFSTEDLASKFNVPVGNARAVIAVMRRTDQVLPASPPKDKGGLSLWVSS